VVLLTTGVSVFMVGVMDVVSCDPGVVADELVARLSDFETVGELLEISERTNSFHSLGTFWRSCLTSRQDVKIAAINASNGQLNCKLL